MKIGEKIPRNFFFLKVTPYMKGIYIKRGHGRNITDDIDMYDADSDTTTVTSGTMKFTKQ